MANKFPNSSMYPQMLEELEAKIVAKRELYHASKDPDDQMVSLSKRIKRFRDRMEEALEVIREAAMEEDAAQEKEQKPRVSMTRPKRVGSLLRAPQQSACRAGQHQHRRP